MILKISKLFQSAPKTFGAKNTFVRGGDNDKTNKIAKNLSKS